MAEDILQHQDVSAIHHKVAGKSMTQNMGSLAGWDIVKNFCLQQITKWRIALFKQLTRGWLEYLLVEFRRDRDRPILFVFRVRVGDFILTQLATTCCL
ncbi:hypothetical protein EA58_13680 [Photobacterium galatheae]|uniref:Uncharacterized protein n=1 Tax=Photobacterium galatheae TaxID=1654360 RepID=A0A066RU53_9GAMM|nr:hypothetical protein EA58_13680 [Photobacterium galatheae]